jgi:hypothetical protein
VEARDSPLLYGTQAADKRPLLDFVLGALRGAGCRILFEPPANKAPFRITFETPGGERMGIVVYAFFANSTPTKNRPADEHRFQIKYGGVLTGLHEIWQDPYGLYTTLLVGIDPVRGFFVAADPCLYNPTRFSVSVEFKRDDAERIQAEGWTAWERIRRGGEASASSKRLARYEHEPAFEVLVGGTAPNFMKLIRFEREALREAPGERHLIAETIDRLVVTPTIPAASGGPAISNARLHALAEEFQLPVDEILDLIAKKRMLKVAVRGHVAEEHLVRVLGRVPGVGECKRIDEDNGPDVSVVFGGKRITIECKTTSRKTTADGLGKIDFQRTRAAKTNPCSRYYEATDFDVVAACTHPLTERWDFLFAPTTALDPHSRCDGRLASNVKLDGRWTPEVASVLASVG